jgi:uncharacterized protein (TIGR02145 family)
MGQLSRRCALVTSAMAVAMLFGCGNAPTEPALVTGTVTDIDGNVYRTVTIGSQVWMAENLKTTRYNDGSAIPLVTDSVAWLNLTTPGYCWYMNEAGSNKAVYGGLYNWHAVNSGVIAPRGWHVPSDAEWTTLTTYLGGDSVAGGNLKEEGTTHWLTPNVGATNSSGFSALGSGFRGYLARFQNLGGGACWWTATTNGALVAWYRMMGRGAASVGRSYTDMKDGYSVRCIQD